MQPRGTWTSAFCFLEFLSMETLGIRWKCQQRVFFKQPLQSRLPSNKEPFRTQLLKEEELTVVRVVRGDLLELLLL